MNSLILLSILLSVALGLARGLDLAFVTEHRAVMIFPLHIIEVMEVVDACRRHVVGMDYATYSADCMEFISIIIHSLRCAIAPIGCHIRIVATHRTAFRSCILTYFHRLGVNAENIFPSINGGCHFPAYLLSKTCRQLSSGIELPATDQVWQIIHAFMVQTVKQIVFAVEVERLGCESQSDNFKVGELRDNSASRYVSQFIVKIPNRSAKL